MRTIVIFPCGVSIIVQASDSLTGSHGALSAASSQLRDEVDDQERIAQVLYATGVQAGKQGGVDWQVRCMSQGTRRAAIDPTLKLSRGTDSATGIMERAGTSQCGLDCRSIAPHAPSLTTSRATRTPIQR